MSLQTIKQCEWTPQTIERFWGYIAGRTDLHKDYFSKQVGQGIVNFIQYTGIIRSQTIALDYGCGPGFLLQYLLNSGVRCNATDVSVEAVQLVNEKYKEHANWCGAIVTSPLSLPYSEQSFDLVTCVETLEHLDENIRTIVFKQIYRMLKPGGTAIFTTPNDENLQYGNIYCPFCETEFHKVQHMHSFTDKELKCLLNNFGYEVLFCKGINFGEFQRKWPNWKDCSLRSLVRRLQYQRCVLLDRVLPRQFPNGRTFNRLTASGPHLCAIVQRPAENVG